MKCNQEVQLENAQKRIFRDAETDDAQATRNVREISRTKITRKKIFMSYLHNTTHSPCLRVLSFLHEFVIKREFYRIHRLFFKHERRTYYV